MMIVNYMEQIKELQVKKEISDLKTLVHCHKDAILQYKEREKSLETRNSALREDNMRLLSRITKLEDENKSLRYIIYNGLDNRSIGVTQVVDKKDDKFLAEVEAQLEDIEEKVSDALERVSDTLEKIYGRNWKIS